MLFFLFLLIFFCFNAYYFCFSVFLQNNFELHFVWKEQLQHFLCIVFSRTNNCIFLFFFLNKNYKIMFCIFLRMLQNHDVIIMRESHTYSEDACSRRFSINCRGKKPNKQKNTAFYLSQTFTTLTPEHFFFFFSAPSALFPVWLSAVHQGCPEHTAEKRPGAFDFHSRWNVTLWFPVLTFKRQEARRRGVIDQSGVVKVSRKGRRKGGPGAGGMKEDRGRDGGAGEMKEGGGWGEGLSEQTSCRTLWVCVCARVCVCCPSDILLIELVLLSVQHSAFKLMVELIFLTLLCLLFVYLPRLVA